MSKRLRWSVRRVAELALYILDSWPVLEWIQGRQPATNAFDRLLDDALRGRVELRMSRMNYGEILYSCWRKFPWDESARFLADIQTLPIEYVDIDNDLVEQAARIKALVSAAYADCFAAALAIREQVPLVTGDEEFRDVSAKFSLQLHWVGA